MNGASLPSPGRDRGFTLPELLIAIVITSTIVTVLAMTIVTSMKTAPSATSRADTAIAVQGITTWLPPDVDSAEPGKFDTDPSTASGCSGGDPAGSTNIIRLQWTETFRGVATTYVANYRYVISGDTGEIVRLSCNGQFGLGTPQQLPMSAKLSTTLPVVTPADFDGDGRDDMITIDLVTLAGEKVQIKAATKNPNETLPPTTTFAPTTTITTTTAATTTTTTTAPNQPPVANNMHIFVNSGSPFPFTLDGSDPDGGALAASEIVNLPSGWVLQKDGPISYTITANGDPGIATLLFTITDTAGAVSANGSLEVEITTAETSTTSSTSTTTTSTTTTTTTTTTTIPPCVVGSISVSPTSIGLQNKNTAKLKSDVTVTISGLSGYCVGLTLQYDTGAPNNQWVQNFATSAPYTVTLKGHPSGTELWATGAHVLYVVDGTTQILKQATLTVTD